MESSTFSVAITAVANCVEVDPSVFKSVCVVGSASTGGGELSVATVESPSLTRVTESVDSSVDETFMAVKHVLSLAYFFLL